MPCKLPLELGHAKDRNRPIPDVQLRTVNVRSILIADLHFCVAVDGSRPIADIRAVQKSQVPPQVGNLQAYLSQWILGVF